MNTPVQTTTEETLELGRTEIAAIREISVTNSLYCEQSTAPTKPLAHMTWLFHQTSTDPKRIEILKESESIENELRRIHRIFNRNIGIGSLTVKKKTLSKLWLRYGSAKPLPLIITMQMLERTALKLAKTPQQRFLISTTACKTADAILADGVLYSNHILIHHDERDDRLFQGNSLDDRVKNMRSATPFGISLKVAESLDKIIGDYDPGETVVKLNGDARFDEFVSMIREIRLYHIFRIMAADLTLTQEGRSGEFIDEIFGRISDDKSLRPGARQILDEIRRTKGLSKNGE